MDYIEGVKKLQICRSRRMLLLPVDSASLAYSILNRCEGRVETRRAREVRSSVEEVVAVERQERSRGEI
jgi:hypothetical protein